MQEQTEQAIRTLEAAANYTLLLVENDTRSVLATGDPIAVVKDFIQLREINERVKMAKKSLEIIEERLSHSEIPDLLRVCNIKNLTIEDLNVRVSVGHKWGCSMLDKQLGFQWLRENGHGGIIIETVNSSTLAAFAKSYAEEGGKELPEDRFKTNISAYTSITKAP